jgi:hypothetical protein
MTKASIANRRITVVIRKPNLELRVNSRTVVSDIDRMDGFMQGSMPSLVQILNADSTCDPSACEPGANRSGRGTRSTDERDPRNSAQSEPLDAPALLGCAGVAYGGGADGGEPHWKSTSDMSAAEGEAPSWVIV